MTVKCSDDNQKDRGMPALSLRFNVVRVTLGAIVISAEPALYAFYPHLRLEAALLFILGVALTVTGLIALSFRRAIVRPRWSQDRIMRALRRAPADTTVQILQTWIPEEDFIDQLRHLYLYDAKRFRLRVMLMNPNEQGTNDVLAARVKLRRITRDDAARQINQTRDGLVRLKQQVDQKLNQLVQSHEDQHAVDLQIRFYNFLPFGPVYRIGEDVMFVGFYLNHTSSIFGPMIEIRQKQSPELWRVLEHNLSEGWRVSELYAPPNAPKEPSDHRQSS